MKVGDLVRYDEGYIGIITRYIPDIDDDDFVEVYWNDGDVCNMSVWDLEVINESR